MADKKSLSFKGFYLECFRATTRNLWGIVFGIITILGVLADKLPWWEVPLDYLMWAIPLAIFTAVFFLAPYKIYKAEKQECNRLQTQLDTRPSIEVRPIKEHDLYCLEVKNRGNTGEFQAQIEMLEGHIHVGMKLNRYLACWEYAPHKEAKILKDQVDKIKIARFISNHPYITQYLHLYYYDPISSGENYIGSDAWFIGSKIIAVNGTEREVTKPEFMLRVTISSEPSLKQGSFVKEYKLGLGGLEELPSQ